MVLKPFKGRFFQMCPGSPGVICCNYRVINTCFGCIYDCAYCFLNSYLNTFGITQFTNTQDLLAEIDNFISTSDGRFLYRIGSGEFTDSMMIDEVTGLGRLLIDKFKDCGNAMLELKTKSDNVDHLLNIKHKGNAVLAWSLNTERNIALYEKDTALLDERLEAAEKACKAGYFLAFHFDPIIVYPEWEKDYKSVVKKLFSVINPEKIVWISMGGFRYTPSFKEILRELFPAEELTVQEMFPGVDGKYRYLKKNRIDIYRKMKSFINEFTDKPFVYLCMETKDVWSSVFGRYYDTSELFEKDFAEYLQKTFF
ncbi:MAG: hypothetical protein JW864_07960 [Spirochaetes bacterium]|nr:hypothetical protein [Spirochaetota bacterium]